MSRKSLFASSQFLRLRHKETGEEFEVDLSKARYDRISKGFLNKIKFSSNKVVKHITLTQRRESYSPRFLNHFFNCMRKRYGSLIYIWTAEIQEKRLMRYGDKVLHWHIIMAFEYETEFTKEDILKIQSYWKHGNADIRHVKSLSVGYLMKYVGKALGLDSAMRRIGSSRIEAFYRQSLSALCKAVQFFGSVSELFDYYWYRGRAFLYEDNVYKRGRCYIYYPRKLWEVVFNSNSNGGLI